LAGGDLIIGITLGKGAFNMARMTRRAALASVAVGAVTAVASPLARAAGRRPGPKALFVVLPPHWLDPVIGDSDDAEEIAARLGKNKKLIELVAKAVKEVKDNPPKPELVGPTYPQRVRVKLLAELCRSGRRVPAKINRSQSEAARGHARFPSGTQPDCELFAAQGARRMRTRYD
jgi:hypothetical protein